MKRDPIFFELFKERPGCFFHLVNRPERDAENYRLEAIEYKATAVRLDGVFRPSSRMSVPRTFGKCSITRRTRSMRTC